MRGLPSTYGKGWLSSNAWDLLQIAIVLGGFPREETMRRVALAGHPGRKTNTATVERVLREIRDEVHNG